MSLIFLIVSFLTGVAIGVVIHFSGFCVFGAIKDLLSSYRARRLTGVIAAILVFALINIWGFKGNISCGGIWNNYAGLHSFLGGLIQGVGYVLIIGCPLALLVRVGQGSKPHLISLLFFALGVSVFGHLKEPIVNSLSPLTLDFQTIIKTQSTEDKWVNQKAYPFTISTVDGGTLTYERENHTLILKHQLSDGSEHIFENRPFLIYIAPECCPFCHPAAIALLKNLTEEYTENGLLVIGIFRNHSLENAIEPFRAKYNVDWILARDPKYALLDRFEITPATFFSIILICRNGTIQLKREGFTKADKDKFNKEIKLLLEETEKNSE